MRASSPDFFLSAGVFRNIYFVPLQSVDIFAIISDVVIRIHLIAIVSD